MIQKYPWRARSKETPGVLLNQGITYLENNYFTEMCSGSEAGSSLRLIDFVYQSTLGLRVDKKKGLPLGVEIVKVVAFGSQGSGCRIWGCAVELMFLRNRTVFLNQGVAYLRLDLVELCDEGVLHPVHQMFCQPAKSILLS